MNSSPKISFPNRQGKDKKIQAQMKRVFAAFHRQPKTMLMASIETGIMRSNITRYVAAWRKYGKISKVRTGICPITKYSKVGFYTTDKNLFTQPLTLF